MKRLTLFCALYLMLFACLSAQDVIVLNNAQTITCYNTDISKGFVYYQLTDDKDAPLSRVSITDVLVVKKQNGEKIVIDGKEPSDAHNAAPIPSSSLDETAIELNDNEYYNYQRLILSFAALTAKSDIGESDKPDWGDRIGFLSGVNLAKKMPIYLCAGVDATYVTMVDNDYRESILAFAVPIQLSYKLGTPHYNFEPFVGIHGKMNAIARLSEVKGDDYCDYLSSKDMGGDEYAFKRMQLGFQMGGGINIRHFYIGYEFRRDITPMQKITDMKTTYHYISACINFF